MHLLRGMHSAFDVHITVSLFSFKAASLFNKLQLLYTSALQIAFDLRFMNLTPIGVNAAGVTWVFGDGRFNGTMHNVVGPTLVPWQPPIFDLQCV